MIYFLINLKLKKKLLFHPFLSMICFCNPSPTRLSCFCFLNISLKNITFALFFCKSIRWKIIYEIKYLLNLMACMTYIEGLVGWLRFTCFFFLNTNWILFLSILSFNIKLIWDLDSHFVFSKIILSTFTCQPGIT
jgi:hypothetical protein